MRLDLFLGEISAGPGEAGSRVAESPTGCSGPQEVRGKVAFMHIHIPYLRFLNKAPKKGRSFFLMILMYDILLHFEITPVTL